jgi:hypothetical protein
MKLIVSFSVAPLRPVDIYNLRFLNKALQGKVK